MVNITNITINLQVAIHTFTKNDLWSVSVYRRSTKLIQTGLFYTSEKEAIKVATDLLSEDNFSM